MGLQFLIFLISGIFNIITNLEIDGCAQIEPLYVLDKVCIATWWTRISLVSKSLYDPYETIQEITNLITVILCIFLLQICRYLQRKEAFRCDVKLITVSDYSIEVTGLPLDCTLSEIKAFFEGFESFIKQKVNIITINRSFYISDFVEITIKIDDLLQEKTISEVYLSLSEKDSQAFSQSESHKKRLLLIESQLNTLSNELKQHKSSLKEKCRFTGTAFITFSTPEESRKIKKLFERNYFDIFFIYLKKTVDIPSNLLFKGNVLTIKRAPEPDDVLWENLGVKWDVKLKKRLMTNLATLSILTMSFVIILIISYFQAFLQKNATLEGLSLTAVNSCGACLIVLINYCLNFSIEKFTKLEKHSTLTNYRSSLAEKKIVAVFFNTALIYILISFYFGNFASKNGLVSNLFYIYLSNMMITILLQFFDPFYLLRLWNRRKLELSPEKAGFTQSDANALYEGPTQNIPFLFSSVVNMMLFTSFYGSLVPFGAIIGMITLFSWYWTYKYLLLRRSSVPNLLGKAMAYEMIEYAEFAPFLFALGDIIFVKILYDQINTINIIAFALSCVNFIFPMKFLNKKLMKIKEKKEFYGKNEDYKKKYQEVRREIPLEYDRCNPATKRRATEEWVNFIENRTGNGDKGGIEEEEIDLGGMEEEILKNSLQRKKEVKSMDMTKIRSIFGGLGKVDENKLL